jgi:hypothetical protein
MKQMRHSDIKLTAKASTDETRLPVYDAIKGLPCLMGCTQIRARISGAAGQNVAQTGAPGEGLSGSEVVGSEVVNLALARCDAGIKMERAKGFEPSTITLAR